MVGITCQDLPGAVAGDIPVNSVTFCFGHITAWAELGLLSVGHFFVVSQGTLGGRAVLVQPNRPFLYTLGPGGGGGGHSRGHGGTLTCYHC